MNVDMPKNLTYSFCTTDGGTTITVEKCRYAAECISTKLETDNRSRIGFETLGDNSAKGDIKVDNKVDNNARGDINVDNKVDNNVGDDTVNDTVKHPQIRTRTTPVQHPYNETQSRTIPGQEPNEADFPELQDVSSSAQRVFRALREDGSLTIRGLSSKLSLNKGTVCVAIGILVKAGIIIRVGSKTYGGHWEIAKR